MSSRFHFHTLKRILKSQQCNLEIAKGRTAKFLPSHLFIIKTTLKTFTFMNYLIFLSSKFFGNARESSLPSIQIEWFRILVQLFLKRQSEWGRQKKNLKKRSVLLMLRDIWYRSVYWFDTLYTLLSCKLNRIRNLSWSFLFYWALKFSLANFFIQCCVKIKGCVKHFPSFLVTW